MHKEDHFVSGDQVAGHLSILDEAAGGKQDASYVNRKELRVIGMSRSGNHAIINWILQQAEGRKLFLNCVEGKSNPFVTARPVHGDVPYVANYDDFVWESEQAGDFSQKDWLVYNYEDSFLGYVCHPRFEDNHDLWVGRSLERYDILILRDPFNLFASRKRATLEGGVSAQVATRIWRQHAREYLGYTRHLRQPKILINYNRWVKDALYRQQIAVRLGLKFTDAGIDTVPRTAGGSSFDSVQFDGAAKQMKVFERWKAFQHDAEYRQMLKPELVDYSHRLFGPVPGVEQLLHNADSF